MRLHAAVSKITAPVAVNPILFTNLIVFPQPGTNMPTRVISSKRKSKPRPFQIGHAPTSPVISTSLLGWTDAAICRERE